VKLSLYGIRAKRLASMASNCDFSPSSSSLTNSSSTLSSASQFNFTVVAKSFNYVPIKLDYGNYLFWKAQILATIRAFDLLPYINKSLAPSKYIHDSETSNHEAQVVNLEYLNWIRSDQLLLSWLFSTIDKEVLAQVIHCETSVEVWSVLENLYSQQNVAKSFQLKQ